MVMAFGMCNVPAMIQQLVNPVFAVRTNCNAYLDDLIVYTLTWFVHIQTLTEVFSITKASLNLAKGDWRGDCNPYRKTSRLMQKSPPSLNVSCPSLGVP